MQRKEDFKYSGMLDHGVTKSMEEHQTFLYPNIPQPPTAPKKKDLQCRRACTIEILIVVLSITIIALLITFATLGGLAIYKFKDSKETPDRSSTELDPERLFEKKIPDWTIFSGQMKVKPTCNRAPYCWDGKDPKSAIFSNAAGMYTTWLDRTFRTSDVTRDYKYEGTIVTNMTCYKISSHENHTRLEFRSIWASNSSPTSKEVGTALVRMASGENQNSNRFSDVDIASITVGDYESNKNDVTYNGAVAANCANLG